ncbi:DUF4301 family protein [Leptobacterium sp. I13]|uniref:DUF4301 family protein n=1 Tax=Leptobacterium meishanense TaxID=3128904 RepID=UPI0030EB8442
MFNKKDLEQFQEKGITAQQVLHQIETFKKGIPFVQLVDAATIGNGICRFSEEEKQQYISTFNAKKDSLELLKFVPASGAATRMFKSLFKFLETFNIEKESFNAYLNKNKAHEIKTFFVGLEKLPFYEKVMQKLASKNYLQSNTSEDYQKYLFVQEMLTADGLYYGNYPKGLLPFHKYNNHIATAFEEHLYEAIKYCETKSMATLHFTISETHNNLFRKTLDELKRTIAKQTDVSFDVSFSYQKPSTDTIAVTFENEPFRNEEGILFFRPSGHGALIENLNEQDADILFIKNIDNVVVSKYKNEIANYKKMLAGKLIEVQEKTFNYAKMLDEKTLNEAELKEIMTFLEKELNHSITADFNKYSGENQIAYLKSCLDRPIRVCGMVKNEGEPGGGPFWVRDEKGQVSLQIIESVQIDKSNEKQKEILKTVTHFNPVDLVCGVRNYKGEKYNLLDYVDPSQGFISHKTYKGTPIKALELPGLWNGAMAHWNTIFVEVPLITFNPVKTINDLLKSTHQVS